MGLSEMQNGEDKVTNEKNWIRHISRYMDQTYFA